MSILSNRVGMYRGAAALHETHIQVCSAVNLLHGYGNTAALSVSCRFRRIAIYLCHPRNTFAYGIQCPDRHPNLKNPCVMEKNLTYFCQYQNNVLPL